VKTDICILGGGIMGLATAYNISKTSNSRVLVLDRYGVGNEYCSSNDVNRVFRYSYGNDELYTRMAVESFAQWGQLEKESQQELLIHTGLLLLQGDDGNANGFNEASYRTLSRMGFGADRLSKTDIEKRFPQFKAEEAFFDHHGGVLLASKSLHSLQALAASKGVKFHQGRARKIFPGDWPHVTTYNSETIEFRRLVVTIGPWTGSLLTSSLARIKATRQQLVYFKTQADFDHFHPGNCPVFFTDKHYGLPTAGLDAVKMAPKELPETVDPETVKRTVDDDQITGCREAFRRFVPELADSEVVRSKVCLYDMTENSDFVMDRDPESSEIVYGYGFSGHGFKFAPLVGKLLAELALDSKPSFDLERFSIIPSKRRKPAIGSHLGKGE
jgi:monomeric sarcosine oxidase